MKINTNGHRILSNIDNPITEVTFYTTSKCQLDCVFCPQSNLDIPTVNFGLKDFKKYAKMLVDSGITMFELSPIVGDTLLDVDLIERIKYLKTLGVKCYFFTNLVALKQSFLDTLFNEDLIDTTEFVVSIYGNTEIEFKKRTGKDLFKIFEQNFIMLIDYFNENKVSIQNLNVRFKFDINKPNFSNIIEKLLWKLYISKSVDISLDPIDVNWNTELIYVKETINDNEPSKHKYCATGICENLIDDLGVWPNGDIGICSSWFDIHKRMILGNLNNNTLEELTNENSLFRKIEKEQHIGLYRSMCKSCNYIS